MKHWVIILILLVSQSLFGQIACSLHNFQFYGEDGPYSEHYLGIQSKTIKFQDGAGTVEYIIKLLKDDDIIHADKYAISIRESEKETDLWDVKRYALEEGEYEIQILLRDVLSQDSMNYNQKMTIAIPDSPSLTKPIICASLQQENLPFEKYGLTYEKLGYDLVGEDQSDIGFLAEAYLSNAYCDDQYVIRYSIFNGFYNPSMTSEDPAKVGYVKQDCASKNFIAKQISTDGLLTGNYHLMLEMLDKDQNVYSSSHSNFQVLRPQTDMELLASQDDQFETSFVQDMSPKQLRYALKAIAPRVDGQRAEILNYVIANDNMRTKRYYVYAYWKEYAPAYPYEAYSKYMEVAKAVDAKYDNNVGYGFESDRGFYFLKYGKPDQVIIEEHEPSAPPYEIWIYNQIHTGETNVKFLFYNPSLSHNDFEILHSTCNSDVRNPRWQLLLYGDAPNEVQGNTMDATSIGDNFGRNAIRLMKDN